MPLILLVRLLTRELSPVWMWVFHFKFWSILQPNSFSVLEGRIVWGPALRLTACLVMSMPLEPITTRWVLSPLITNLLLTMQFSISLYFLVSLAESMAGSLWTIVQVPSST